MIPQKDEKKSDKSLAKFSKILALALLMSGALIAVRMLENVLSQTTALHNQASETQAAELNRDTDSLLGTARQACQDTYDKFRNHFGM